MGTEKVVPCLGMPQIAGGRPLVSNPRHAQPRLVQRRLDTWELKACDAEDLLDQVYREQQQIDSLLQQLAMLRQQSPDVTGPQPAATHATHHL